MSGGISQLIKEMNSDELFYPEISKEEIIEIIDGVIKKLTLVPKKLNMKRITTGTNLTPKKKRRKK